MRHPAISTIALFIIALAMAVLYFKHLNPPGQQAGKVLQSIPRDAALVFEFKNDTAVYDIFKNSTIFSNLMGAEKTNELNLLRYKLLHSTALNNALNGQSIFISVHPRPHANRLEFLLTVYSHDDLRDAIYDLTKQGVAEGIQVNTVLFNRQSGFAITLNSIGKTFYLLPNEDGILSGSFDKELVIACANNQHSQQPAVFTPLPDQQSANSIANLYVNYLQLSPLFDELFANKNNELFRDLCSLPATASLTLNYKPDAIMFSGTSNINPDMPTGYLHIFTRQQPAVNKLKAMFPASTAYSINFAVSEPGKFETDLANWQTQSGAATEKKLLFDRIKRETGVEPYQSFKNMLGNEFAIITTRYQEKLAIVQLKNGMKFKPYMVNMSTMLNEDAGQLNYDKLPYYLLGDAFGIFRRPYFIIVDNYMLICASQTGLMEYYRNYTAGNLLNKSEDFTRFDDLQNTQSNISFFVNFKNAAGLFKADLKPEFAKVFETDGEGWTNYYAASLQFTSAENNFYTNFYMRLNTRDTVSLMP